MNDVHFDRKHSNIICCLHIFMTIGLYILQHLAYVLSKSGKNVVILATDTLSRGHGTVEQIDQV